MVKRLNELVTERFVHTKNNREEQNISNSREQLKKFFSRYPRYTEDVVRSRSRINGPSYLTTLSFWEFGDLFTMSYNTFFRKGGSFLVNMRRPNVEFLYITYPQSQRNSVIVSYINNKIKEAGFILDNEK